MLWKVSTLGREREENSRRWDEQRQKGEEPRTFQDLKAGGQGQSTSTRRHKAAVGAARDKSCRSWEDVVRDLNLILLDVNKQER